MTRIKKLVMEGFKSFAKRTELLFDQPFSVVLGANGSGKSNVMDALCFVLGKSSSKAMRAEKSANLIYNGGKTSSPAKHAEVSIYFDNAQKEFPIDAHEVKITRIVKYDGSSKYKMNDKTTTRLEVVELLGHAGIDPNGYNIILQGDIVSLVEMSPVDRRAIIEEIAGIGAYEEKKKKAMSELEKVDVKLGEADIILKERESSLKELKKDRDQAQKYKELSDRIKQNKATYVKMQLDKKVEEKSKFDSRHDKYAQALKKTQDSIAHKREEVSLRKRSMDKISKEIENKGEKEQVLLQKEIERLKIDQATKSARIQSCSNELVKIVQKKEHTSKNIEEIQRKIKALLDEERDLSVVKKKKAELKDDLENKISLFKKKHKLDEDSGLEKETETLQKQSQTLREQQQELLREQDRIEFQLQTIEEKIKKVIGVEKEHKEEIELLKKKKEQFNKLVVELNDILNKDAHDAKKLSLIRKELHELQESAHALEVKLAGIREAQSSNIAVKKVMENKHALGEVFDVVSALGSVDAKFASALEIAAGAKAGSVVVSDDATAARCIAFLKQNRLGVATFLPLNKVKLTPVDESLKQFLKTKGVYGFAVDLVTFDARFKNVFSYVFGSTLVVDTIDTARKIGIGKAKMVTLDGDLSELSGAMSGGFHTKKTTGKFGGSDVQKSLDSAQENIVALESEFSSLEKIRQVNEERIVKIRELKSGLEGEIIKSEKSLHLDSEDLFASQQYKKELEEKLAEVTAQKKKADLELSTFTKKITDLKIKRQTLKNKIAELKNPAVLAELNAFEQKRKEVQEELMKHEGELKSLTLQRTDIHERDKENSEKILKELDKENEHFTKEQKTLSENLSTLEEHISEKEKAQEAFYKQFKTLFDERNKLNAQVNILETEILKLDESSRQEELAMNSLSVELARIKAELAGLQAEFEQYMGVELLNDASEADLKKEIAQHEKFLANIGSVNMRALEIYDTVKSEYEKLLEKKNTLTLEREEVMNLMTEIELQKTELFVKAFDTVNKNFADIFSQLSEKGSAYLELEDSKNIFDGGMLIKVRITGEKFLDIRSLSGGEKTLTALAFIFAIQEHNPASFYLLDEVDAALDKKNSSLLGVLVKKYCDRAQYIVISHQDQLIRHADALYGVTLRGDGSGQSAVVSMKV